MIGYSLARVPKNQPSLIIATHIQRVLLVSLLMVSITSASTGTTVIAIWTGQHLLLAADSKATHGSAAPTLACKIVRERGCFFTAAGYIAEGYPRYDAISLGREACNSPGGINEKAEQFKLVSARDIPKFVKQLKLANPRRYESLVEGRTMLSIFFAGRQSSAFKIISIDILMNEAGEGFFRQSEISSGEKPGAQFFLGGVRNEIVNYVNTHKISAASLTDAQAVEMLRKLINLEIKSHPKEVGPPISILKIRTDGTSEWIEPGECPKGNQGKHPD